MPTLTVTSDCYLEEPGPDLQRAIKDRLTIDNPKYIAARKYGRWIGKKLKPRLSYYQLTDNGIRFPRGFTNQAITMCRQIVGKNPVILDKRRRLPELAISFQGNLRDYQEGAVEQVCSRSFGVLEAGTGSGKTVMALATVCRRQQPTIIIVHTKELLYQWQERIKKFLGEEAGLVGDAKFELKPITVAIVNSARKKIDQLVPCFGQVIVDECHRVPATLFTDVVTHFDCYFLLGLSATAFRSDEGMTRLIYYFMGERVHRVDQLHLQVTGAVVTPRVIRKETTFTYDYRGNYQALITALTGHEGRNRQIADDIIMVVSARPDDTVLVVSDRVSHCKTFEVLLENRGFEVSLLTGQVAAEKRLEIVTAVQHGRVQVLIATLQLISEGFDCPGLSTLFLTTPITFEGRLLQVIGRIMRPAENKTAAVYDYIDAAIPTLQRSADARKKVLLSL